MANTPEGDAARARAAVWLRAYIEESGLNQTQFGVETGVSKAHISEILSGKGSPGWETLLKLWCTVKFSVDDIFGGLPDERDRRRIRTNVAAIRAHSAAADEHAPGHRRRRAAGD